MKQTRSIAMAGIAALALQVRAGGFVHDQTLGDFYPYVVHFPETNTEALPPAVVNLGGKGSMFEQDVTLSIDNVVSYGLSGWRVGNYINGSTDPTDALVANEFLTIIPYQYLWYGTNMTWQAIRDVVEDAKTKYPFDPDRVYLASYSMGSRFAWPILNSDPDYYAGAMISAGIPFEAPSELTNMSTVPLRVYAGAQDYEEASQVWQMTEYAQSLQSMGAQNVELIVLPNGTHNSMQQDPFDADLYYWFLNQTRGQNPSQSQAPQISATYAAIESVNAISTQANAFSIYQAGFPSGSAPMTTPTDIAAQITNASAAWASIVSATSVVGSSISPALVPSAVIAAAKSSAGITAKVGLATFSIATAATIIFSLI